MTTMSLLSEVSAYTVFTEGLHTSSANISALSAGFKPWVFNPSTAGMSLRKTAHYNENDICVAIIACLKSNGTIF